MEKRDSARCTGNEQRNEQQTKELTRVRCSLCCASLLSHVLTLFSYARNHFSSIVSVYALHCFTRASRAVTVCHFLSPPLPDVALSASAAPPKASHPLTYGDLKWRARFALRIYEVMHLRIFEDVSLQHPHVHRPRSYSSLFTLPRASCTPCLLIFLLVSSLCSSAMRCTSFCCGCALLSSPTVRVPVACASVGIFCQLQPWLLRTQISTLRLIEERCWDKNNLGLLSKCQRLQRTLTRVFSVHRELRRKLTQSVRV